jgi:hypothetical protein
MPLDDPREIHVAVRDDEKGYVERYYREATDKSRSCQERFTSLHLAYEHAQSEVTHAIASGYSEHAAQREALNRLARVRVAGEDLIQQCTKKRRKQKLIDFNAAGEKKP